MTVEIEVERPERVDHPERIEDRSESPVFVPSRNDAIEEDEEPINIDNSEADAIEPTEEEEDDAKV